MLGLGQWKGWVVLAVVAGIAWITLGVIDDDRTDIVFGVVIAVICSVRATLAYRKQSGG